MGKDMFSRGDFELLATSLKGIEGAFIMTVNDVPELREMFSWAAIGTAELTYSTGIKNGCKAKELVITNRPGSLAAGGLGNY